MAFLGRSRSRSRSPGPLTFASCRIFCKAFVYILYSYHAHYRLALASFIPFYNFRLQSSRTHPAFASSRSPTCISCCSLLCLVSTFFVLVFSLHTTWGLTRWCALFIVHTKVYFYSMISPHANVLNSLSCAIRLSSLSISNYWCFHWLLARNVNVLLLSIFAFLLLLVLWHSAYLFLYV